MKPYHEKKYGIDSDYSNITLLDIAKKIWEKKILVIIVGVSFMIISYFLSSFFIQPKYNSVTKIYIVNNKDSNVTKEDLELSSILMKDYEEIIKSRPVLTKVISGLGLKYNYDQIKNKVNVSSPLDTRIINITVTTDSPKLSQQIANELRSVSMENIKKITKIEDVTILEDASYNNKNIAMSSKKVAFLGFLFGVALVIMGVIISVIFNDKIKNPEDVENKLHKPLLGVIPYGKK